MLKSRYKIIFFLILIYSSLFTPLLKAQDAQETPFIADFNDDIRQVSPGEQFVFEINFKIPPGYYLYDDKTSLLFQKTGDIELLKSSRPEPENHYDEFFKKNLKVYFKNFTQNVVFHVPETAEKGRRILEATLTYQGCSTDFCFRPVKKTILLPVQVNPVGAKLENASPDSRITSKPKVMVQNERPSFWQLLRENNPEMLLNQGKVYVLALAFAGGILTSLTPCVLPIIPLTLAFIGVRRHKKGNLIRAFCLVAGLVAMYSILGFLAANLGLKLGFLFQSKYFVLLTALFFLIFALGLFGIIPFQLPQGLHQKFARMGGEGPIGAFVAGLTIGLIASPCVGPLIAPLLLIAAKTQDRFYGFLLLLNYGMGMGLLFLVLASGFAELNQKLRSGRWTAILKKGLGVLMLLPALYYGYAFAKPYLGHARDSLWVYNFDEGLSLAQKTGKPVLLDFYANWCPPCLELDRKTFSQEEVRKLGQEFVMLKIDCSVDDANCQKATKQFQVVGWPTVLFLDSRGEPIKGVSWVGGFADKVKMLDLMKAALEKNR